MYEKLCIIYQILVNEIFKGIESVANDSQKTPPDVVRFQNYNQMNRKQANKMKLELIILFPSLFLTV